jgi:hypothetical protein
MQNLSRKRVAAAPGIAHKAALLFDVPAGGWNDIKSAVLVSDSETSPPVSNLGQAERKKLETGASQAREFDHKTNPSSVLELEDWMCLVWFEAALAGRLRAKPLIIGSFVAYALDMAHRERRDARDPWPVIRREYNNLCSIFNDVKTELS